MLSWFGGLRIRTKLNMMTGGFLIGLLIFGVLSRDTIETVKINGAQYQRIIRGKDVIADVLPPPAYAIEAYLVTHLTLDALEKDDSGAIERLEARTKILREEYEARQKVWSDALTPCPLKTALTVGAYKSGAHFFNLRDEQFGPAVAAKNKVRARELLRTVLTPAYEEHRAAVDKVVVLATERNAFDEREAATTLSNRMILFVSLGLLLFALSAFLGFATTRGIVTPLGNMVDVLRKTSDTDDLTLRLDVKGTDEVALAGHSFNAFVEKLQAMMREARKVAEVVSSGSQEVSSNADEISGGAQEQAACLEETAASLEEITSTIKQNAENARQAAELAGRSRDVAELGGSVVESAVAAMSAIAESSVRISDIISTIDEIAFQTNILALNAAVEAARAGEHGRGFAVVASEVRSLAQRSAGAAKEIKNLIADSAKKVDAGAIHVNKSGDTLKEIVASVKRVTDMVTEIASASQEQATGVQQVNKAVSQVDHVTQTNAARTEEMSSTAESLAKQAEQLRALVKRFRLDSTDAADSPPDAPDARDQSRNHPPARKPAAVQRQGKRKAQANSEVVAIGANGAHRSRTGTDGFEEF